ncbi:MAG: dUTP diphosphatase [Spirochaetia bacterium]|nr:dUTP diphosphatase [Spirochaetia bacterium]
MAKEGLPETEASPVTVKIHRRPGAKLPERATAGAACFDVSACLETDTEIVISPNDRLTVPTGLYFEIPDGYYISLRPRSGLAFKNGITLLNTPATIDSDYRGELKVLLINLGHEDFRIKHGDRIAQLMLEKIEPINFLETDFSELEDSQRGSGGFGSTGIA